MDAGGARHDLSPEERANLARTEAGATVKLLTSCPSCLQGLSRYQDDAGVEAEYIVVEMARHVLGPRWLEEYVQRANTGGIERVLV